MRKLFVLVLFLSFGVLDASAGKRGVIDVGLNRAELVSLDTPMDEVMIANPEVADVVVHGSNKISVVGKKIGSTNIRFFGSDSKLLKEVDVIVGYDLPAIRRTLDRFYPDLNLSIETINTSLAVSGVVPDAQTSNRVMQIVYEFVKESRRDEDSDTASFKEKDNRFPGIVNLMKLNSSQQVMLRVKIGEMKRTAAKALGLNLQSFSTGNNGGFSFATGGGRQMFNPNGGAFGQFTEAEGNPFVSGIGSFVRGDFGIGAMFDALESDGLFKVLAEPNLTTVSGETANFLAGGEFPIPISQGDGETTVEFKPYGVSLAFTPYVLSNNRIRLTVAPELSEIDNSNRVSGVPGVTTRKSKSTVELAPGEALMVAGLIRDVISNDINEVPGIAEVPIISSLFRSTSYQREETELVIAITPYIVDPIIGSEIRMPSDEYRTPSFMESVFYGALGSMSGQASRIGQTPVLEGPIGFMMD